MGTGSRILTAVAALLLLAVYVFPLWRYDLGAPQYPEGLEMTIWAHKIGGKLALVNQLNHYIGMKEIHPDSIAELRWIPWLVALLSASGLVVAVIGRFSWLVVWFALLAALGLAGLVDFYWWLYDYGTNLSPDAPIKLPPFVPPLIGTQDLANFEVSSYPAAGGVAAFVAGVAAALAVGLEWRRRRG